MSLDQSYLRAEAPAPGSDTPTSTITITSVGTCRLADPLSAIAKTHPIRRDLTNVYGFVHTSKEILQQLDVFEGRELPPELQRFICSARYEAPQLRGATDLFFVEVSSQKEVHYRGHLLQINCLDRVFQDRRELFDTLFRHKYPQEREARARALEQLPSFRDADPVERSILLESHVHLTTRDELACDMQVILGRLPAPVVFVCHIDVPDSAGKVIETRSRLCAWMREICTENGYTLFDPAPQVIAYGRVRALAENGRDTNHYTTEFKPVLGSLLFDTYALPLMRSRGALAAVPGSALGEARLPAVAPVLPAEPEAPAATTAPAPSPKAVPPAASKPAPDEKVPAPAASPKRIVTATGAALEVRNIVSEAKAAIGRGEMDEAEVLLRGAVIDHPGSAELFGLLGAVAFHRGDNTVALADLQRALQLDRQAVEPRVLLVKIAQRLNRHEEACTHALELVASVPDDHKALSVAAKALLKAKRFHEAASVFRRVAMLRPEEAGPLVEVARCELKSRNPEEAVRAADAALQRDTTDLGALTLKAEALQRLKRMDDLAVIALRLVAVDPAAAMALVPALIATTHHEHAAAVIAAVRRHGHGNASDPIMQAGLVRSLTQRARAATERGEDTAAAAAWHAVRLIEPDNARAASGLRKLVSPIRKEARAKGAAGDLGGAIAVCQRGLALDPADATLLRDHAQLLERSARWIEASRAWEALSHTASGGPDHIVRAARAAARGGELVEALRQYATLPEDMLRQAASTVASLTRKLVSSMRLDFVEGRYDDAVRKATIIRAMDPRNVAAARLLSRAVSSYRKLYKAALADQDAAAQEEFCRRILGIDPNRADALKALVKIYSGAKRWREVIEILERLTQLEPGEPRHWHKLASACRAVRRYELGVSAALKAVELEPGNAKGLERLSDMLNRQALAA